MDLKAKYLLETCSDPIGFLNQLRQTTEPIGGGTVYSEDGELVEYDVAVEAIKKATDTFIEKAVKFIHERLMFEDTRWYKNGEQTLEDKVIEDFKSILKERVRL